MNDVSERADGLQPSLTKPCVHPKVDFMAPTSDRVTSYFMLERPKLPHTAWVWPTKFLVCQARAQEAGIPLNYEHLLR
jgi:hypothetical protein